MRKITKQELGLAIVFAVAGFFFSSKEWIMHLNSLTPIEGLVTYYALLFAILLLLSKLGLIVYKLRIKSVPQVFGLLLITFAFFIIVDWESQYVQYTTEGSLEGASNVFLQSEDGATFYFWHDVQGVKDIEQARLLTYVFTPFALTLAGSYLVTKTRLGI